MAGQVEYRTRPLPALDGTGHRLRHHLLLGGAHGDDDEAHHRQDSVQGRVCAWPDPRCGRPEDVEIQGQRARPDRPDRRHRTRRPGRETHHGPDEPQGRRQDREAHAQGIPERHSRLRHRCAALHLPLAGFAGSRHQVRHAALRGLPQLLQQVVERLALRADELRRAGLRPRAQRKTRIGCLQRHPSRLLPGRPLDRQPPAEGRAGSRAALRRLPLRPAFARHL